MNAALGDRSGFPHLAASVYANHAAVSPPSAAVIAAANEAMVDVARLGVAAVGPWMARREALREAVAAFVGASPADVGFPPGTTRGIVDLALAVPWRPGDRVITFEGEFPSNVTPWVTAAREAGGEALSVPLAGFADGSGDGLARVEAALRAGSVRVIAVSAVQFQTGLRMPLRALSDLAHAHGAWLFVDGIQAVGGLPIDVRALGIDLLVAGTHKWLMGLDGLAIAVASPAVRAALRPRTAGWLSHEQALGFLLEGAGHLRYDRPLKASLDWMEGGVMTTAAFAGLEASLRILAALGPAAIHDHAQRWIDPVDAALRARGFTSARAASAEARSNLLCVKTPAGVRLIGFAEALAARGVAVSTPDGWLRFSPHWPNALAEVPRVIHAVDDALAAG